MAKHIREVQIEAYRGIEELKLEGLNHINMLIGDNNSGKTSVLEIISSVDNPHNIGTWVAITREYTSRRRNFFNGLREVEFKKEDALLDTTCMHLSVSLNGTRINQYQIYDFENRVSMFVDKKKSFVRTVYVSPNDHAMGKVYLHNVLADAELYEEMLQILQEFDENIISINSVKVNEFSESLEYMVLTRNHKRALPLKVYGDGMKKAIVLLSAVLEAKNGILLLDEFETAIHTSAMDTIFSWILESAKKLNVQVFLTSHSKEAIDKVLRCKENLQPDINVYTLYKQNGKNLVRSMNCYEAMKAQDSLGLELR